MGLSTKPHVAFACVDSHAALSHAALLEAPVWTAVRLCHTCGFARSTCVDKALADMKEIWLVKNLVHKL